MKKIIIYIAILLLPFVALSQGHNGDSLVEQRIYLEEVNVVKRTSSQVIIGTNKLIKSVPAVLGEADIIKYIITLPGVASTSALDPNFYVRGGAGYENRYLVSGFPVTSPQHLTGILSLFDPYVLTGASLYKSGYPARFSGVLSSYLNMFPNRKRDSLWHGEATLGLVSSSLRSRGPVGKRDGVFAVSVRSSYLELLTRIANKIEEDVDVVPYSFSDITASYMQSIGNDWRTEFFGLYSYDKLALEDDGGLKFSWNTYSFNGQLHRQRERSILSFRAGSSGKDVKGSYIALASTPETMRSNSVRAEVEYNYLYDHGSALSAGVSSEMTSLISSIDNSSHRDFLSTLWLSLRHTTNWDLSLEVGANLELYSGVANTIAASPRLRINYEPSGWQLWGDYSRTTQYTAYVRMLSSPSPVDLILPIESGDQPSVCDQVSIGAERALPYGLHLYTALFYRRYSNAKEVVGSSLAQNFLDLGSVNQINGIGEAKGFEMELSLALPNLYARANYTLSDSWRQFDEINDGRKIKPPYDITHNVLVALEYRLSKKIKINGMWVYCSGTYTTFPVGIGLANNIHTQSPIIVPIYKDIYNYRLPATHRLDISFEYSRSKWTTNVGVYNAYNQPNISFVDFQIKEKDKYQVQIVPKGFVLLPIIPYISIKYKW